MESSGFFNAEIQSDGSYDRVYMAEQFAKYFSMFIGNGVFITPATQLKVVPKAGEMSIGISVGDAYINGYWYKNNSLMYKKLSNANGTQARIDRVVIRWDSSTRTIYADVLEGTPAAIPEAPQVTRSADIYELALADIAIGKAVTEIKTENITDLRNNSNLCGYVKGVVDQIDTTDLFSQFTAAFNSWFADLQSKGNARYETFDELLTQYSSEFNTWFEGIKSQLEGDVATKLTQQISDLQENKANLDDVKSSRGQNLIAYPYYDRDSVVSGITWTVNSDGTITANGTATSNSYFNLSNVNFKMQIMPGTYIMSVKAANVDLLLKVDSRTGAVYHAGSAFTLTGKHSCKVFLRIVKGVTVDNVKVYPMLEEGSIAHIYQPTILSNETLNNTKAKKSKSRNYTLLASGWSGSSAPYSFTLSATGVTASNNVELVVPSSITVAQVEAYQSAAIVTGTQANGSITLKAYGEKPAIDLPITVIVRGD